MSLKMGCGDGYESQVIGRQHGAVTRKRATRIVFVAKEQAWTGCDFISTQVMSAGHYVLGFARGLLKTPRPRTQVKRKRCNRQLGRLGEEAYAMEELIAELGSAYLCAHCHINGELHHATYLKSWLSVLTQDKRTLFTAAAKAQAAADFVLNPLLSSAPIQEVAA